MTTTGGNKLPVTIVKAAIYISIAQLIAGLIYQFVLVKDESFDMSRFSAYFSVALVLLAIDRVFHVVLVKGVTDKSAYSASQETNLKEGEQGLKWFGALAGVTMPFLKGVPFVCVSMPPLMALWGVHKSYAMGQLVMNSLGLTFLPSSTVLQLTFFSLWYSIGTVIIDLQIRASWIYWKRAKESHS